MINGEFMSGCHNGGTCPVNKIWQSYSCRCVIGFTGKNCDISNKYKFIEKLNSKVLGPVFLFSREKISEYYSANSHDILSGKTM